MFLRLLASNIHVTRLAAIQLVMMHASTSLMLSIALSNPGIAPQSAPASMPPANASTHTSHVGNRPICETMPDAASSPLPVPRESAIKSVAAAPARYCPGAPMLKRPVLYATATERPVKITGVARKSRLPMEVGLKPNVRLPAALRPVLNRPANTSRMPSHALFSPSSGLQMPTIRMMMLPAPRPMSIESSDACTVRAPSDFTSREKLFLLMPLPPPLSAALRRTCKGPALPPSFASDRARRRFRPRT